MTDKKFEITGKCNLNCEACYNKKMLEKLQDIPVENLLKNIKRTDVIYIGGGEPMLYPQIQELSEKLFNISQEIVISTNGIIYKPILKEIQIQASLWTLNPELYNTLLGGTKKQFKSSMKNINQYINNGNPVLLNMPVYSKNINEIESISDYAKSMGVKLRISPIFPSNGFSCTKDLEKKIEDEVFKLKLKGREIIYSKHKIPVQRYFLID